MNERLSVTPIEGAVILLNEISGRLPHDPKVGVALHGNGWREDYYFPGKESIRPETFLGDSTKSQLLIDSIHQALGTLADRQRIVVQMRFGLTASSESYSTLHTLKEIGDEFGFGKSRAQQIIAKALRTLRHPSRFKELEQFLPEAQILP